jgi:formyltetrahydrofolate hydrolase
MGTTDTARGQEYVLTLSRPDKPGIVYAVSSFLIQQSATILASQRHRGSPDGSDLARRAPHTVQRRSDRGLPLTPEPAERSHGHQRL